jgi:DNA-binding MarR family transcriptional regulator
MTKLDPLIHAPKRLRIMSLLRHSDALEFQFLKERLDLSPSDLSKQMTALVDAGYVRMRKTGKGPGSSTWYRLTREGRKAFESHVAALRALLDQPAVPGG